MFKILFLFCFFLFCNFLFYSYSTSKRIYSFIIHSCLFNLFIQVYELLLIFSLGFHNIQIIGCYEDIEKIADSFNLFHRIF